MPPRVKRSQYAPRLPVQLMIKLLLYTAQAVLVHAHIPQHLRGYVVLRVKPLELFLEVHALEL